VRRKGTRLHRAQHGRARVVRLLAARAIRSPSMFEIEERGGLGRRALWTRGDRSLTTPLVLSVQEGPRAAPSYAEALFVSERTEDPRFQIRHGGSFFAPRPAAHPDDLPPTKGTPLSLEGLEIPQEVVAGDLAIVTGESDLPSAKSAQAIFLANGPEFERSPREVVAMVRRVREPPDPPGVAPCRTGGCGSAGNVGSRLRAGPRRLSVTWTCVHTSSASRTRRSPGARCSRTRRRRSRDPRSCGSAVGSGSGTRNRPRHASSCCCPAPPESRILRVAATAGSGTRFGRAPTLPSSTKSL